MVDLQNIDNCPTLDEVYEYVRNPVLAEFCSKISEKYNINASMEYSKCSWEPGWNIKFKKSGKSLCTIYLRENYFTVLVVVGKKEKETIEEMLPECTPEMRAIYKQTEEGNGQRWLMIDLEDLGPLYADVLRFIEVRRNSR